MMQEITFFLHSVVIFYVVLDNQVCMTSVVFLQS